MAAAETWGLRFDTTQEHTAFYTRGIPLGWGLQGAHGEPSFPFEAPAEHRVAARQLALRLWNRQRRSVRAGGAPRLFPDDGSEFSA